jgi:hypothetical protein
MPAGCLHRTVLSLGTIRSAVGVVYHEHSRSSGEIPFHSIRTRLYFRSLSPLNNISQENTTSSQHNQNGRNSNRDSPAVSHPYRRER